MHLGGLSDFEGKNFTNVSHGTYFIIDRYRMELHSINLVIRGYHLGYHVYQDIWAAPIEAVLPRVLLCKRERFNPSEPYAVRYAVGGHVT